MRTMTTVLAASLLSFQGIALAQESGAQAQESGAQTGQEPRPEQEPRQGIPATKHQTQTVDEIKSERFSQLDEDGNRSISREEAQAETKLTDNWSTYDEDGDGSLNLEEYSEFERTSASGDATSGDTSGMLGIGETEQDMPATRHQQQRVGDDLIGELDRDGDGAISKDEAEGEAGLSGQWDQLDRNSDGKLDAQELSDQQ